MGAGGRDAAARQPFAPTSRSHRDAHWIMSRAGVIQVNRRAASYRRDFQPQRNARIKFLPRQVFAGGDATRLTMS
jgi:hypothetical protein